MSKLQRKGKESQSKSPAGENHIDIINQIFAVAAIVAKSPKCKRPKPTNTQK